MEVVPTERLMRAKKMLIYFRTVCKDCVICGGRADNIFRSATLSDAKQKAYKKFMAHLLSKKDKGYNKSDYKEVCNTLSTLSDDPCSIEYVRPFITFVQCIMYIIQTKFPNVIMSR